MSDLVQVAVSVPTPEPVALLSTSRPPKAVCVPNPEPVALLSTMRRPTAVSPVVDPPAP